MQASIWWVTAKDAMRTYSFSPIWNASIGGVTANMLFKPSKIENKIKEIATQSSQQEITKLSQQDLFWDTKKIQEAKGISSQEALLNTMKYYQEKGFQVEWVDLDSEIQALSPKQIEQEEDKNLLQSVWGALKVESKFDINPEDDKTLWGAMKNSLKQLANAGRFALNMPWDTIEFAWDMVDIISNPIETAKGIWILAWALASKVWITEDTPERDAVIEWIKQEIEKNFGTGERALETITQNPFDVLTTVFGGASATKAIAQKSWASTQTLQKLENLKEITNPINVLKTEGKLVSWAVSKVWEWVTDIWTTITSKISGIAPESLTTIFKNPELFQEAKKGTITREATAEKVVWAINKRMDEVWDLGKEYAKIREYTWPIRVEAITPDEILKKFNIVEKDGVLDFSKSSIGSTGNKNAIQSAYNLILERKQSLTSWDDMLALRQALDDTINYKTEATWAAEKIVRAMRGNIDDVAKQDIPWLKELDSKFWKEIQELNKTKALIYDKSWAIKDTYIRDIANLLWKWKEAKIERIEKLVPEIRQEIRALKALEDVQLAKGQKVWTYAQQMIGAGTFVATADPITTIVAFLLTSPTVISNILQTAWYGARTIWWIVEKVKQGIKLTTQEANIVSKAVRDQINEQALKGKEALWNKLDDLADKTSARAKFIDDGGKSLDDFGDLNNRKLQLEEKFQEISDRWFNEWKDTRKLKDDPIVKKLNEEYIDVTNKLKGK